MVEMVEMVGMELLLRVLERLPQQQRKLPKPQHRATVFCCTRTAVCSG